MTQTLLLVCWSWITSFICCEATEVPLIPVFHDDACQFTGVAISHSRRMFLNYPRWQSPHRYDVVEVLSNGFVRPYPDLAWNAWTEGKNASNHWVCVQAVYVDDQDTLWVVDPASPEMQGVQNKGAKLVSIDLKTDSVLRTYNLSDLLGKKSFLNDVRVDTRTGTAYLTDSAKGGIVVIDLASGKSRLALSNHYSGKANPSQQLIVDWGGTGAKRQAFQGQFGRHRFESG